MSNLEKLKRIEELKQAIDETKQRIQDIEDVNSIEFRKANMYLNKLNEELAKYEKLEEAIKLTTPIYTEAASVLEITTLITNHFKEVYGISVYVYDEANHTYRIVLGKDIQRDNQKATEDVFRKDLEKLFAEYSNEVYVYYAEDGYVVFAYPKDGAVVNPPEQVEHQIPVYESVNKHDVKNAVSEANIILDDKFIWVFTVLDGEGEVIEEDIYEIDRAITLTAETPNAEMIVAYPYVDPDPENEAVDLVFADNPGPTILYDGRKATRPKEEMEEKLTKEELQAIERGEESLAKDQLKEAVLTEGTNNYAMSDKDYLTLLYIPEDPESLLDLLDEDEAALDELEQLAIVENWVDHYAEEAYRAWEDIVYDLNIKMNDEVTGWYDEDQYGNYEFYEIHAGYYEGFSVIVNPNVDYFMYSYESATEEDAHRAFRMAEQLLYDFNAKDVYQYDAPPLKPSKDLKRRVKIRYESVIDEDDEVAEIWVDTSYNGVSKVVAFNGNINEILRKRYIADNTYDVVLLTLDELHSKGYVVSEDLAIKVNDEVYTLDELEGLDSAEYEEATQAADVNKQVYFPKKKKAPKKTMKEAAETFDKAQVVDTIKLLVKWYNNQDRAVYKSVRRDHKKGKDIVKTETGLQAATNEAISIVSNNNEQLVLDAFVALIKAAEDKAIKAELTEVAKWFKKLVNKAKLSTAANNKEADNKQGDTLDELAKKAGLTEARIKQLKNIVITEASRKKLEEYSIEELKKILYNKKRKSVLMLEEAKTKLEPEHIDKVYRKLFKLEKETEAIFDEIVNRGKVKPGKKV